MAELGPVLVVIPTYQERDNLGPVLTRLHAAVPDADVLIVDDASPDGTGKLADEMAATSPWISVLHRPGKEGLGAAYLAGFAKASNSSTDRCRKRITKQRIVSPWETIRTRLPFLRSARSHMLSTKPEIRS